MTHFPRLFYPGFFAVLILVLGFAIPADAASKSEIDAESAAAMERFHNLVNGSEELLAEAAGYLIFPDIKKAGLGIGGENGPGALVVDGITVAYYRATSASIGFQLGFQKRSQILIFMTQEALQKFRASSNWEIGADASVALITLDAGGRLNTETIDDPVIAFVFGAKGLMYNLTLEGTKVSLINPK